MMGPLILPFLACSLMRCAALQGVKLKLQRHTSEQHTTIVLGAHGEAVEHAANHPTADSPTSMEFRGDGDVQMLEEPSASHLDDIKGNDDRALLSTRRGAAKGSTVKLVIGGTKTCEKKAFPDPGEFYRPIYNKRIRCYNSDGKEVCEECSGTSDCWHGVGGTCDGSLDKSPMKVEASSSKYVRHINRAYVCQGGKDKLVLKMKSLSANGALKFYFDGNLIHSGTGDKDKEWSNPGSGSHELVIEYTPSRRREQPSATIGELFFEFDSESVSCKEYEQACFLYLKDDESLRNYNANQLACLDNDYAAGTCLQWKSCLQNTGVVDRVRAMLLAGQLGNSLLQESSCVPDASSDAVTCFDPETQDVEELNCGSCESTWADQCVEKCPATPLDECFKAIACDHTDVCNSWKSCACTEQTACRNNLTAFIEEDGTGNKALIRRANKTSMKKSVNREDNVLDDSLGDKCTG